MAKSKKAGKPTPKKRPVEQYEHKGKQRLNNPPVGLVNADTDPDMKAELPKKTYKYDPHLDPQFVWAGKAEHTSFEIPTVSLHVHERIDPRSIIEAVRKKNGSNYEQLSLFSSREENPPLRDAIDFYKHQHNWSNRLIAGDSLLVMNSLLEKEGLGGQVQMIYFDPPYGIKYGSNFQPFVNKRDVKDGKDENLTAEPEMIKAFRDTWELGIHSYLTYLRDRLLLARELLSESGSVFVQISDENIHHVRELMDEVFGEKNFCQIIPFRKKLMPLGAKVIEGMMDYLLFYAKDIEQIKFRQLYRMSLPKFTSRWTNVELPDRTRKKLSKEEADNFDLLPPGSRVFRLVSQRAPSFSESNVYDFRFNGRTFKPPVGGCWVTTREKMQTLADSKRLEAEGDNLSYVYFHDDFPYSKITNFWDDTSPVQGKSYVVQTSELVIARCLLMTTDPGDLVFDPTCVRKGTRVLTGSTSLCPPASGGMIGGWKSIEDIVPGDKVFSHDGQLHKVTRVIKRQYAGPMIGLRSEGSTGMLWLTEDHLVLSNRRVQHLSKHGGWSGIPVSHFERAREFRREMTPPERILWKRIRSNQIGVKFRRQHPIGPYITDFYTRDAGLVLEVDGAQHRETEEAIEHDRVRDEYMHSLGLKVLRFAASEVLKEPDRVLDAIYEATREQVLQEDPSKQWRYAGNLAVGDMVFAGIELHPVVLAEVRIGQTVEEVYDLEVEGAHSFITEVCTVHNCGSGTTAYVAEEWGRRWITCDTSRVAVALAKQRLMTSVFDYFELAHPEEGVGSGFLYKTVPHITLKSIANNEPPAQETLFDKPFPDNSRTRVTGPFTVEAVPAPSVKPIAEPTPSLSPPYEGGESAGSDSYISRTGETLRQREWRDELLKSGIRGKKGQYILFSCIEPLAGTRWLHAEAETKPNDRGAKSVREDMPDASKPQRVVISFGPEHAPLEQRQVELAWEEARSLVPKPALLVFASFQFDPEAAKDIDETDPKKAGMTFLKVQMNSDLLTDDLKKKRGGDSFWLVGQPDVKLVAIKSGEDKGRYKVEVLGFDYYNTKTGTIESGGNERIAMWLLDTDYDGRSVFPRQVFFPMAGENEGWSRLARNLKAEIDEDLIDAYRGTVSLPFEPGKYKRIAVKIVDDRGIESLRVMELE